MRSNDSAPGALSSRSARPRTSSPSSSHYSSSTYFIYFDFNPPVITNTTINKYPADPNAQNLSDQYLTVSPNPFTSQTTITFSEEQKNTTIKTLDVLGKEIKTMDFSGKQFILEKREMLPGIYFIQIIDSNKSVVNKKIILQ